MWRLEAVPVLMLCISTIYGECKSILVVCVAIKTPYMANTFSRTVIAVIGSYDNVKFNRAYHTSKYAHAHSSGPI